MSDYDWDDIRTTLDKIAGGEGEWDAERKAAHAALVECWDAVNDAANKANLTDQMPHIGDRPDWRRMPKKAARILQILDTAQSTPTGTAAAVLGRLREGGGVTMAQLREVTDVSEKEIRDAIKVIRITNQSDNPEHPVSYSGKWWLAKELSAMGKNLQPTARGSLKVVGKPREQKEEKSTYKGKSKKELISDVATLLDDHPDAEKVVLEVVTRIDRHFSTKAIYKDVCATARKAKEQAEANLKDAVESGRENGDNEAALVKLDSIETAWQAKEETLAEGIEQRKEARTNKKQAELDLERLMANLRQLELDL